MIAYKLDELARAADVAARTVRYYVQRGLLPAPEFRGKDTAYGPEHLLRLRAIKQLQQAHLPLEAIAARLAGASPVELERLAGASSASPLPAAPAPAARAERWERFTLAPGVELHLDSDAGPDAQRLARAILAQHGPAPSPRKP